MRSSLCSRGATLPPPSVWPISTSLSANSSELFLRLNNWRLPNAAHRPALNAFGHGIAGKSLDPQFGVTTEQRNDFRGAEGVVHEDLEHGAIDKNADVQLSFGGIERQGEIRMLRTARFMIARGQRKRQW